MGIGHGLSRIEKQKEERGRRKDKSSTKRNDGNGRWKRHVECL